MADAEEIWPEPEELEWWDLAMCQGLPTKMFFNDYENDAEVAKNVDDICLSCLVRPQCLQWASENGASGCWGGIYLTAGRADRQRNAHKTADIWEQVTKL